MKLSQIQTITEDTHLDYTGIDEHIKFWLEQYKPHYQQWALQQIRNGENWVSIIDAINYYNNKITDNRFQQILNKVTPTPKNILTLSLDQIKTAQSEYDQKYGVPSKRSLKRELKKNYTTKLIDTPDLTIIEIKKTDDTDGAAKVLSDLARGTKWCVTDTNIGDSYLQEGPIYLIIMNDEKYLCHAESRQLMDPSDKPVTIDDTIYNQLIPYIPQIGIFHRNTNSQAYKNAIKTIPKLAYYHANDVIEGRWPEAEPWIMKDPEWAYNYADNVIKGRWPEAEPWIMKNPYLSYCYAHDIIKGRWPEAEPIIMKDPYSSYHYADFIIRGRWPEAEPTIMKDPEWAFYYARDIIGGRWPEAEPTIMKDPYWAHFYNKSVSMSPRYSMK